MRLIAALLIAFALTGCANYQREVEFTKWSVEERAKADAGEIKYATLYSRYYDRLSELQPSPVRNAMLRATVDMIPVARDFDDGKITKTQFDDARRRANTQIADAQLGAQQAQQQATNRALENWQRSYQPLPAPQPTPFPRATNCTSQQFGNTVHTNCN